MLRDGEANPLNVHGLRELKHCPPHFIKVKFNIVCAPKQISDWIWENLEGRFWFGDWYDTSENTKSIVMHSCVAFENPGEASMFSLCLDTIQQTNYSNLF